MSVEPVNLRRLAESIATEAGHMVLAGRRGGITDATTKSSATDVVTEFDRASEQFIVARLASQRPDDSIVGEEGTETPGTSGISWLIDPIDGTTNFLYDLPGYAVSIAACDTHGPLASAVYLPRTNELFSAHRNGGSTLDGHRIAVSGASDLATSLIATGFSYLPHRRVRQAARVTQLLPLVRDIRRLGAASVDLCYVACGRLDAYFEEWLGPWDLAAGQLIASEAGARLGNLTGGLVEPASVVASAPGLFQPLIDLLAITSHGSPPGSM